MISSDQCFLETTNEQCGQKRFQLLHFVEYGGRCIQQICKKSCWPVLEMLTTTAWHMPTKSANRKHGRRLKPTFSHTQYDFLAINHRCPEITIGFCLVKLVFTSASRCSCTLQREVSGLAGAWMMTTCCRPKNVRLRSGWWLCWCGALDLASLNLDL